MSPHTKIEEAIKLALKAGWKKGQDPILFGSGIETDDGAYLCKADCFLDKDFWQCLGKSLGWITKEELNDEYCEKCGQFHSGAKERGDFYCYKCGGKIIERKREVERREWLEHWQEFIDYLAEGKSPESFFESLLSTSNTTK